MDLIESPALVSYRSSGSAINAVNIYWFSVL